jgi:hypothetical protein
MSKGLQVTGYVRLLAFWPTDVFDLADGYDHEV